MDDMINRHDSIAEENIEPNGRPAKDQFEEWSGEVADRADDAFKNDKKDGPIKDREKHFGGVFHSYDFVEEGLCTWSL